MSNIYHKNKSVAQQYHGDRAFPVSTTMTLFLFIIPGQVATCPYNNRVQLKFSVS